MKSPEIDRKIENALCYVEVHVQEMRRTLLVSNNSFWNGGIPKIELR